MSDDGGDSEDVRGYKLRQPYIGHVVDELITTERSYVKDLRDIVHVRTEL